MTDKPQRKRWEYNLSRLRKDYTDEQKIIVFQRDYDDATGGVLCADSRCTLPITEREAPFMDLHHKIPLGTVGTNFSENKALAHHTCNSRIGKPVAPHNIQTEGERKGQGATPDLGALRWSNKEGEKSEEMIEAYDEWIADRVTGPFSKYEEVTLSLLIHTAPTVLGKWLTDPVTQRRRLVKLGVPQTYRGYVMVDIASGRLKGHKVKGRYWVHYVGEIKEGARPQPIAEEELPEEEKG